LAHRYILFHKPYGVVSQFSGEESRCTLKDFIDVPGVYPVGRLDHDSEGLMLLTDDGWVQHRLTDPRFGHPRTYWAQVEGIPDDRALQQELSRGIRIRDYQTLPAKARLLPSEPLFPPRHPAIRFRKNIPTAWIEITLTEGRNRQVRRMTAALGYPTLRLVRVAIGDLRLEGLASGQRRDLTSAEVAGLRR
jgi:23S rRNA pseudouridine2457 synthase